MDLLKSAAILSAVVEAGYRVTSRRYRHLSRIDRPDWFEWMNQHNFFGRLKPEEKDQWEDHYRRCFCRDRLVLPTHFDIKAIPNSGGGSRPTGYLDDGGKAEKWLTRNGAYRAR